MRQFIRAQDAECPVDLDEGVSCRAGSSSFWGTWDGRMMPCGMMTTPTVFPLESGFDAAWQQLRQLTRQIRMPRECVTCPKQKVCSVCAAVCLAETGAFDQVPRYVCHMTDATIAAMDRERTDKE
jgi:radical SAM protein with 4Fe4S-binding SPASM domain